MPYVKVTLTKRPYRDKSANIVDIEDRLNRPGIDEFSGGGHEGYPDIDRAEVTDWIQKGAIVLFAADAIPESVQSEVLTDEQAEQLKRDVFGIIP